MRLITRSDFDGLVCGALLEELGIANEIVYIHPKDLQDNKIAVTPNDVIANAPYVEGCGIWFDHHSSEHERLKLAGRFIGASHPVPSAAQVIYDYFAAFNKSIRKLKTLVEAASLVDSARYSRDDILNPSGLIMLAFITYPRTGLGFKHNFGISNLELMKQLPKLLRTKSVGEILASPDFQERIQVYKDENENYRQFVDRTTIKGDVILIDFRKIKKTPVGNRFMEYVLFQKKNISIRISDSKNWRYAVINIGHSIINRSAKVNVGSLALQYGGGGHFQVGSCQVLQEKADQTVSGMLKVIHDN